MTTYLEGLIHKPGNTSFAKDYASAMLKEVQKRFPNKGMQNDLYTFGLFVHPYYRGNLLKLISNEEYLSRYCLKNCKGKVCCVCV
jgi:hypothetical protein